MRFLPANVCILSLLFLMICIESQSSFGELAISQYPHAASDLVAVLRAGYRRGQSTSQWLVAPDFPQSTSELVISLRGGYRRRRRDWQTAVSDDSNDESASDDGDPEFEIEEDMESPKLTFEKDHRRRSYSDYSDEDELSSDEEPSRRRRAAHKQQTSRRAHDRHSTSHRSRHSGNTRRHHRSAVEPTAPSTSPYPRRRNRHPPPPQYSPRWGTRADMALEAALRGKQVDFMSSSSPSRSSSPESVERVSKHRRGQQANRAHVRKRKQRIATHSDEWSSMSSDEVAQRPRKGNVSQRENGIGGQHKGYGGGHGFWGGMGNGFGGGGMSLGDVGGMGLEWDRDGLEGTRLNQEELALLGEGPGGEEAAKGAHATGERNALPPSHSSSDEAVASRRSEAAGGQGQSAREERDAEDVLERTSSGSGAAAPAAQQEHTAELFEALKTPTRPEQPKTADGSHFEDEQAPAPTSPAARAEKASSPAAQHEEQSKAAASDDQTSVSAPHLSSLRMSSPSSSSSPASSRRSRQEASLVGGAAGRESGMESQEGRLQRPSCLTTPPLSSEAESVLDRRPESESGESEEDVEMEEEEDWTGNAEKTQEGLSRMLAETEACGGVLVVPHGIKGRGANHWRSVTAQSGQCGRGEQQEGVRLRAVEAAEEEAARAAREAVEEIERRVEGDLREAGMGGTEQLTSRLESARETARMLTTVLEERRNGPAALQRGAAQGGRGGAVMGEVEERARRWRRETVMKGLWSKVREGVPRTALTTRKGTEERPEGGAPPTKTVYVGGTDGGETEAGLRERFGGCGRIERVECGTGWGFVNFGDRAAVDKAVQRGEDGDLLVLPAPRGRVVRGGIELSMAC